MSETNGQPVLDWEEVFERVSRQVFILQRPSCTGTAFLVSQGFAHADTKIHYVFATAWHCIEDVLSETSFKLIRRVDNTEIEINTDHAITIRLGPESWDLGFVIVRTEPGLVRTMDMLPIPKPDNFPGLGADLAWAGHPTSVIPEIVMCRGSIACLVHDPPALLVDGRVFPGMSGGPVVDQRCQLVGLVSGYWTDAVQPELPGLLVCAPSLMIDHVLRERWGAWVLYKNRCE